MSVVKDILYVDDEPQDLLGDVDDPRMYGRFEDWFPTDGSAFPAQAATANLWVFDFYNDPEQKAKPDIHGVATNGLSLFQQFRLLTEDERPPAVLASNDLEAALGCVVLTERRHVLAEQVGVEWVVGKQVDDYDPLSEIFALANGTKLVHSHAGELRNADLGAYATVFAGTVLGLPARRVWSKGAVHDVAEWRPPVWLSPHDARKPRYAKAGFPLRQGIRSAREVISWMIRRVLPYPSFLVRERHVAVRLGLTIACLRDALQAPTRIAKLLASARYRGALADFDGARWWSAAIDSIVWDLPREEEPRTRALQELLAPVALVRLDLVDPVLVSNADLIETDEVRSAADCVRASDEYFPPQSAYAWVKTEEAREDKALARKVRQEDQAELTGR